MSPQFTRSNVIVGQSQALRHLLAITLRPKHEFLHACMHIVPEQVQDETFASCLTAVR